MQVYPNPASHTIFFSPEVMSATISDGRGKLLYSGDAEKVEVKDWPKGIYLLKLSDKNGQSSHKKLLKD